MQQHQWTKFLTLLDQNQSEIRDHSLQDELGGLWELLVNQKILSYAGRLERIFCSHCQSGPNLLQWVTNNSAVFHCNNCGVQRTNAERASRWQIDIPTLIEQIRSAAGIVGEVEQTIPNVLWRLGSRTAGPTRYGPQYLVLGGDISTQIRIGQILQKQRDAFLWVLTDRSPALTSEARPENSFVLSEFFSWSDGKLVFDQIEFKQGYRPLNQNAAQPRKLKTRKESNVRNKLKKYLMDRVKDARQIVAKDKELGSIPKLPKVPSKKLIAKELKTSRPTITRLTTASDDVQIQVLWHQLQSLELLLITDPKEVLAKILSKKAEISEEGET